MSLVLKIGGFYNAPEKNYIEGKNDVVDYIACISWFFSRLEFVFKPYLVYPEWIIN